MSSLRPTLRDAKPGTPCMTNGTAYLMILNAINPQEGLIHGKLEDGHGHYCAIGNYFEVNPRTCLPNSLIDEVAAVNDSMPTLSSRQRKIKVAQWLRWKLRSMGMTFRGPKPKGAR